MQSWLWDGIPSSCLTIISRAVPLPDSPCERDIFLLPCCPTPPIVKGCRRTQQTHGRRRLTTELANDAVNSLNCVARHKNSSLTSRMHVESMVKKHSALWRHLCGEALRRQSTARSEQVGADAALSALLKGMTDYSVSSSQGNLAS